MFYVFHKLPCYVETLTLSTKLLETCYFLELANRHNKIALLDF